MNLPKRTPRQATAEARPVRRAGLALAAASLLVVGGTACESDGATPAGDAAPAASASTEPGDQAASPSDTASPTSGARSPDAEEDGTATSGEGDGPGKSSPDRTEKLVDGSEARITEVGEQHYVAEIVSKGAVVATLETDGHDAGLNANGMFVALTLGGDLASWMGNDHQGPGTFELEGGWKAKVTKVGELRYRAQIIGHDGVAGTLETDGHDTGLDANGVYIVLSNGGVISSHK
ncbi:hypothetical protein M3398_13745 [Streptomyces albidoflavus]|uniref:hypothetical protein n=1 Tax=Streptomyces TaxID=1883 RepID=UPI0013612AAC|nr:MULTISPECIES: hypothetical protein [Streptomyces]MYX47955.1 hypothetical protein [Streptomyces sp. SID8385]MBK3384714.1 hypothetical protein [Streptomyces sp. DEF147AK]MCL6278361.1 hypothetical protein [Streptomyces albidoflavus]MCX4464901.1 hypothetical protein [Streptomyces albidoflavus]WSI93683.1 hypothetical protein OG695_18230 [Streptomyces albidoflavus]